MKIAHFDCFGLIGENDPLFKVFTGEDDPIISSKKVSDFLNAIDSDVTDIVVHINSRGGSVDEGFAIHDLLQNSGKKITTRVEGQASSIASVVLFAGSVRQITENSKVMIHNPWIDPTLIAGLEADELLQMGSDMKREETRILDFYAKQTGVDKTKLAEMMKEETSFDSSTALEMKFVTEIVKPVKALAFLNLKKQNDMSKEVKTIGQKLDSVLAMLKTGFKAQGGNDLKIITADNIELSVADPEGLGKPTIGAQVNGKDNKPVPSATFKMPDGTQIVTDAASKIEAITEPEVLIAKVGDTIKDNDGKPMVNASVVDEHGNTIKTDAEGKVTEVIAKTSDADVIAENVALKAKVLAMENEQKEFDKKLTLIMGSIQSNYQPPAGSTQFRVIPDVKVDIATAAADRKATYKQKAGKQIANPVN